MSKYVGKVASDVNVGDTVSFFGVTGEVVANDFIIANEDRRLTVSSDDLEFCMYVELDEDEYVFVNNPNYVPPKVVEVGHTEPVSSIAAREQVLLGGTPVKVVSASSCPYGIRIDLENEGVLILPSDSHLSIAQDATESNLAASNDDGVDEHRSDVERPSDRFFSDLPRELLRKGDSVDFYGGEILVESVDTHPNRTAVTMRGGSRCDIYDEEITIVNQKLKRFVEDVGIEHLSQKEFEAIKRATELSLISDRRKDA